MDKYVLAATPRQDSGKGAARQARRAGVVPAVVYGRKTEARSLVVSEREFSRLQRAAGAGTQLVHLEIEGDAKTTVALVKEVQRAPITGLPLHIDFHAVVLDELVTVSVPVELTGTSRGEAEGGILQQVYREIEVSCLPLAIPANLTVDISDLELNSSITVDQVALPEGATLVTSGDEPLVTCSVPAIEAEEAEGEEAGAVEEGEAGEEPAETAAEADGDE